MLRQIASGLCFAAAAICGLLGLLVREGTMELIVLDVRVPVTANRLWLAALGLLLAGAVLAALGRRTG
ncbi:MAG: hypothetical protein ACRD4U_00175 [Candidatus Acidiferrales bacterium]